MASATAAGTRALASSPIFAEGRPAARQHVAAGTPRCVGLPSPILPSQSRETLKPASYYHEITRDVVSMATGEAPAQVATELPEIVKNIQEAWDKLEDKYAVTTLALAAVIGLYGSAGMISAIDRLPLVPGLLELVGIGYTGWFAYRHLVFKPDREALMAKIKVIYDDIIGG
ncbi:Thylakoid membrane phosphoprotein 14 kDa, chloroplastic [Apostasia shenzhenica]|uniref:Thylakoid membrane phosphoprotein 14 kDa, chloroplastic n=1 Tax=Apostasia shenzhenica TaxID=1088818 RepID=A0A2H9ZTG5_9ASPA|nr:Thylakoid membrane phosphoprotein 14 kDa, chloroplastic [Apostasia shenzhenica]